MLKNVILSEAKDLDRSSRSFASLRMTGPRWSAVLLALLAGAQFCLLLGRQDITASHEGRVAQTAREMLESGDWLIPHLASKPRLQKPPLPYWCAAALWKITGTTRTLPVALARFPAAFCGAFATLLIAGLGRRFFGRTGGVLCGLVWLSTWFVVDEFRKAMADPYLAFFTLAAVWAWTSRGASRGVGVSPTRKTIRTARRRDARATALTLLFWTALALGVLAKGPFIFLHVAIAIGTYHIVLRRRPTWSRAHLLGFAIFLLLALPWPLYILTHVPNVIETWKRESLGEAAGLRNAQPFYHYLVALPLTTAPWSVVAIIGAIWPFARKRPRDKLLRWPLLWLAMTVLVFSLAPQKKIAYLLPAMPAQTLLIAGTLVLVLREIRRLTSVRILVVGHAIGAAIAVVVVYALLWHGVLAAHRANYGAGLAAAIGLAAAVSAVRFALAKPRAAVTVSLVAVTFASSFFGIAGYLRPDYENRRSSVPFVLAVNSTVDDARVARAGFISEEVQFYLRRPMESFDDVSDLPPDFTGFVLVADENLPRLRAARPTSQIAAQTANRPPSDRTFLLRVAPVLSRGDYSIELEQLILPLHRLDE